MTSKADLAKKAQGMQKDFDFAKADYQIELDTSKGKITLELFPDVAPNHCRNILALSKAGFYDNLIFHRIVPDFVIQGGCPTGNGTGGPGYHVKQEFNERKHVTGTLSMARAQSPDSAGSQFFLCLKPVPFLDNQYTVFGQTADEASRKIVEEIGDVETGPGDRPLEDVQIKSATVVETPK